VPDITVMKSTAALFVAQGMELEEIQYMVLYVHPLYDTHVLMLLLYV
jgi:hypothetical protein